MKLRLKKKGSQVNLTKRNFLAQGGEGSVYVKDGIAYKIYTDPSKMIALQKIEELSKLTRIEVVKPDDVLLDSKGKQVGYSMRQVVDARALCKIFTAAFKKRHGVNPNQIGKLVDNMRDVLQHIHSHRVLVVDLNELNLLIDKSMSSVMWIDVDSYQTPSFPATAIMASVKDHHSKSFSEMSDWFSFAVVTFQMWIGVHPYKGKHPKVKGMTERMKGNLSVFNKDVSVPRICPPVDIIPPAYKTWYKNVLEDGERMPPPLVLGRSLAVPKVRAIISTDKLKISELLSCDREILYFVELGSHRLSFTAGGLQIGRLIHKDVDSSHRAGLGPKQSIVAVHIVNKCLRLRNLSARSAIEIELAADALMSYDGRVYCKSGDDICEIELMEMPSGKIRASARKVASVMPESTRLFSGVVMQDMLGTWFASVFPAPGRSHQLRIPELAGWKLVDARYDGRVLMIVGARKGAYRRWVLILKQDYSGYECRETCDISYAGLNFVVLDTGVCAHLNEDEKLELFSNSIGSTQKKVVESSALDAGMTLFKCGGSVAFSRGKKLYRLSTR